MKVNLHEQLFPQVVFETNKEGNPIQGSYKKLLEAVKNGSYFKVGLDTGTYEEIISFLSVVITEDCIVGIQPFIKSSASKSAFIDGKDASYEPFCSIMMYSTDRSYSILRYKINGSYGDSSFRTLNDYTYYRWFTNGGKWAQVYQSQTDDMEGKNQLLSILKEGGNDFKVSFEIENVTYFLKPNIVYFPKSKTPLISVKTYPTVLVDSGKHYDLTNFDTFDIADFLIDISGDVSALIYKSFKPHKPSFLNRAIRYAKRMRSTFGFRQNERIGHLKWKCPVKWFVKVNPEKVI